MVERYAKTLRLAGINPDLVDSITTEDDGRTVVVTYRSYLGFGDPEFITFTERHPTREET